MKYNAEERNVSPDFRTSNYALSRSALFGVEEFAYRRHYIRRTNITINEQFIGNTVPQAIGFSTPEKYNSRLRLERNRV